MKLIARLTIWVTVVAGLAIALNAQPANKQLVPVNASVGDVTDSRTTGSFNSECKIELKFTGDAANDAATVRQVRLKKAIDELGRDLNRGDAFDSFGSSSSGQRNGALKAQVRVRNPSRNATLIKLLEGEVELFNPTAANGGILTVRDILKHPAEAVQDPALKKYGIEVMYLTKESYEAKKKELEEKQKNEAGGQIGEAFGELFKGMFGSMMSSGGKNAVKLYVKDPEKRIIELDFQDSTGKPLKRNGSFSSGEMRQFEFNAPLPAEAQLFIQLATPESLQTLPFRIENVPLP